MKSSKESIKFDIVFITLKNNFTISTYQFSASTLKIIVQNLAVFMKNCAITIGNWRFFLRISTVQPPTTIHDLQNHWRIKEITLWKISQLTFELLPVENLASGIHPDVWVVQDVEVWSKENLDTLPSPFQGNTCNYNWLQLNVIVFGVWVIWMIIVSSFNLDAFN